MNYPVIQPPIDYNPNRHGYRFLTRTNTGTLHPGIDLNGGNSANADLGMPMVAPADGTVIFSQYAGSGWGNLVVIHHENLQRWSRIAHWQRVDVTAGQRVTKGQQIGTVGQSGTTSPHAHWEIIKRQIPNWTFYPNGWSASMILGYWEDPLDYVERKNQELSTPDWANPAIQKAIQKGIALDWQNPNEIVGNQTLEYILKNLGGINQLEGNVTKARLITALDKLGLLD